MAYEIVTSLKGPVTLRFVDAGTYSVELTDMSANAAIETVTAAQITDAVWSTSGSISVNRNAAPILNLNYSGSMINMDGVLPSVGANTSTSNVRVVITGAGCLILKLKKFYTMNVDFNKGIFNT